MDTAALSLYIHFPWCRNRCGYCDFNTYVMDESQRGQSVVPYLNAMDAELSRVGHSASNHVVTTIYFGGGTPSLMAAEDYDYLLDSIHHVFEVDPHAEITTEANPETLTLAHLERIRATGVNRLSLGMQSAVPEVLKTLDRVHTPGRVLDVVEWAREAGFDNLSLDLIYGTPGESMHDWETSIDVALSLDPDHLSAYSLIVEDGTPMARWIAAGVLPDVDEDDLADKYIRADELFYAAGFSWYEVSNWSHPGFECQHNLAYWHGDSWRGIGAGAHSHDGRSRWWNSKYPPTYVSAITTGSSPVTSREILTEEQKRIEEIMLGLRLAEGVEYSLLTDSELTRAERFLISGHLLRRGSRLICTLKGRLIADGIVRDILD